MADLSLDDLAVFVRVVERGGFASAARELRTPTSTVSRTITRLEELAGVRLLHRTTREVRPTIEGRELYANVAPSVSTLRAAGRTLEPSSRQPRGRLRVAAPNDLCANFLADVIVGFADRYPLVQLEFSLGNQQENLVGAGFDVAVRAASAIGNSSLIARKLGELELRLYASPTYMRRHGAPATASDLSGHKCVIFRPSSSPNSNDASKTWTLRSASGEANIPVRARICGDDLTFVRAMVVAGGGIGLLPHINCAADEASGRLVPILPDHHVRGATLYVVYPSAKNVPARVTAFRDFVVEAFTSWSARQATTAALKPTS